MADSLFRIRRIRPADDQKVAAIIRAVMPTFGAVGPGFAINDPEVDHMCRAYARPGAAFFVVEFGAGEAAEVVGGAGVAPLDGTAADAQTCELRKMYFLPAARGHGVGARLLALCLRVARELGYSRCYLETLGGMNQAIKLYERFGFARLPGSLGSTGHHGCDRYYLRSVAELGDIALLIAAADFLPDRAAEGNPG